MKTLSESLLDTIHRTGNIVLATHINPDGDALGSLLGMADILTGMGKKVFRYLEEPVSHLYAVSAGQSPAPDRSGGSGRFCPGGGSGCAVYRS